MMCPTEKGYWHPLNPIPQTLPHCRATTALPPTSRSHQAAAAAVATIAFVFIVIIVTVIAVVSVAIAAAACS